MCCEWYHTWFKYQGQCRSKHIKFSTGNGRFRSNKVSSGIKSCLTYKIRSYFCKLNRFGLDKCQLGSEPKSRISFKLTR